VCLGLRLPQVWRQARLDKQLSRAQAYADRNNLGPQARFRTTTFPPHPWFMDGTTRILWLFLNGLRQSGCYLTGPHGNPSVKSGSVFLAASHRLLMVRTPIVRLLLSGSSNRHSTPSGYRSHRQRNHGFIPPRAWHSITPSITATEYLRQGANCHRSIPRHFLRG
jgi:hypothetical protein